MSAHNTTLNVANINRIVAGTEIHTVQDLLADGGQVVETWSDDQLAGTHRSAKTVKNYISATLSFMDYLQVKGYNETGRVRVAAARVRKGLQHLVKAQEAETAAANAGRWYSNHYIRHESILRHIDVNNTSYTRSRHGQNFQESPTTLGMLHSNCSF